MTKPLNSSTCSDIGGNTSFICLVGVGTIINLAKVNIITCMLPLSLGQRVAI